MRRPILWCSACLVAFALAAAACGSDGDGGGEGAVTPGSPDSGTTPPGPATADGGTSPSEDGGLPGLPQDGVSVLALGKGQDMTRAMARQADDGVILAGDINDRIGSSPYKQWPFVARVVGGALDPMFGIGGKVFLPAEAQVRAVAVQSDQKIVVAGVALTETGNYASVFVARLTPKGQLDTTFAGKGFVNENIPVMGVGVAVQADGGVLVVGDAISGGSGSKVVRFTSAGAVDGAFGTAGIASLGAGTSRSIAVAADGTILAGFGDKIARLTSGGQPDATFDGDGVVDTGLTGAFGGPLTLLPLADGKLVVAAGTAQNGVLLQRYTQAGALDTTFGGTNTGAVTTNLLAQFFGGLFRTADGSLLGNAGSRITKYSADGVLDPSYATNGTATHGGFNVNGGALLSTGDLVIGGNFYNSIDYVLDTGLYKYSAAGVQDTKYGAAYNQPGLVAINTGSSTEAASALAELPDGKILATFDSTWRGTVARLGSDLKLDATFGKNGLAQTKAYSDGIQGARSFTRQPDGKIVFAAEKSGGVLVRATADGAIDATFPTTAVPGGADAEIGSDASGAIVVASGDTAVKVRRYGADGAPDATFAGGTGVASVDKGKRRGFVVLSDGRSLVLAQGAKPTLVRLAANGTPDAAFGGTGAVDLAGAAAPAGLALQPDGKVVVLATDAAGTSLTLERRGTDGALDATFGTLGLVTETFAASRSVVSQPPRVAVLEGGKIAVAWVEGEVFHAIRLLPTGARDTAFGGGKKTIGDPSNHYFLRVLAPGAGGAMLLGGGAFTSLGAVDVALVRLP